MYISRSLFSSAYLHLKHNAHSTTPSILILVALDTDSLCATRILTQLLKRDFLPHKIHPVTGYKDLSNVNNTLIKGNEDLRFVICLGLGGMVDLEEFLNLEKDGGAFIECWVVDSRRPWNLHNIFGKKGGLNGQDEDNPVLVRGHGGGYGIAGAKVSGGRWNVGGKVGGVKCFDDGDVEEELANEGTAFVELLGMPEMDSDDDSSSEESDHEDLALARNFPRDPNGALLALSDDASRKRKSDDGIDGGAEGDADDNSRNWRRKTVHDDESPAGSPKLHKHLLLNRPSTRLLSKTPSLPNPHHGNHGSLLPVSSHRQSPSLPSPLSSRRTLRKDLRILRRKHEHTITHYYSAGIWYGEPISGIMYSLASDLGREDNDLLWLAIIGVCSGEIYGRGISPSSGDSSFIAREERIRGVLKDEVRRLNPPELFSGNGASASAGLIQTTADSPNDTSIRISPEFRFMLIRHWSLYDSMLHSAYLGAKLRIWSENGRKKLHKLLAKMGFSLAQCKQRYTHMDMSLKRSLREKLEGIAELYGINDVVKEGFVRSWGWKACLSATDVAVVVGGILEIGEKKGGTAIPGSGDLQDGASIIAVGFRGLEEERENENKEERREEEQQLGRFYEAYDALDNIDSLIAALPTAMTLHRAIVRTGTSLIEKRQIRLLRAFRMAVVKEGPDVTLFTHPSALTKLALWVSEAVYEQEREENRKRHLPIVLAALNERRGVYIVVGMGPAARKMPGGHAGQKQKQRGGGKQKHKTGSGDECDDVEEEREEAAESNDGSDDEVVIEKGYTRNRFGIAFQEVATSTNARMKVDSFEACVVEVKKDDLHGFFESLSFKAVVG